MSGKQVVLAVLVVGMSILGATAAAQDEKNDLGGSIGRIFISDQGITGPNAPTINPVIHSGKGLTFEINYAHRLLGHDVYSLSLEKYLRFSILMKISTPAARWSPWITNKYSSPPRSA